MFWHPSPSVLLHQLTYNFIKNNMIRPSGSSSLNTAFKLFRFPQAQHTPNALKSIKMVLSKNQVHLCILWAELNNCSFTNMVRNYCWLFWFSLKIRAFQFLRLCHDWIHIPCLTSSTRSRPYFLGFQICFWILCCHGSSLTIISAMLLV